MSQGPPKAAPGGTLYRVQAGCKINLSLQITGIRPDGYHELDSLFYPLPQPCDVLHIHIPHAPTQAARGKGGAAQQEPETGLWLSCDTPGIDPAHNTLTKAYALYAEATGFAPALAVRLEKGIPQGAGLGGGSADAAALLRFLNARAARPCSPARLLALGTAVGADVPFFLQDSPCRVTGLGEKLQPLPPVLSGWHVVLLCPAVHISTIWAYGAWDAKNVEKKITPLLTSSPLKAKEFVFRQTCLANAFEEVVFPAQPSLRRYKEALLQAGADVAFMSGSGASLVGLFRNAQAAQKTVQAFIRQELEEQSEGLRVYGLAL